MSYVWIGMFISYQGEWEIDKSKVLYFNNIIMAKVRIESIKVKNYRSFWPTEQEFIFPDGNFKRPIAIIGYNNCGKTNLMNVLKWIFLAVKFRKYEFLPVKSFSTVKDL